MSDLITEKQRTVDEVAHRRTLARITGAAGLVTVVVVLGSSLANNYQSAAFTSNADETVRFFRSIDDTFGQLSSFATAVGLIAMLWFSLGLALLLRRYDGPLPWRSAFLAGAGVVSVVSGPDRLVGRGGIPVRRHRPPGGALRLRSREPVVREQLGRARGGLAVCGPDHRLGQVPAELARLVGHRRGHRPGARPGVLDPRRGARTRHGVLDLGRRLVGVAAARTNRNTWRCGMIATAGTAATAPVAADAGSALLGRITVSAVTLYLVVGGLCGLTWAAGLRGWMVELAAGDSTSSVTWLTFVLLLLPGLAIGVLLGWSAYLRSTGLPGTRWLIFTPALLAAPCSTQRSSRRSTTPGKAAGFSW
jgi:hypothetical protein